MHLIKIIYKKERRILFNRINLDLKSRIFSLRLIMQILQTSGPIFRSSEDFLQIIKTSLCVSLSRNGVSSIAELFEMALFNFVELLDKFKAHLKIQIEVNKIVSFEFL
jgi:brefeldin A-inhibited guanine nucleotide-exchange protein